MPASRFRFGILVVTMISMLTLLPGCTKEPGVVDPLQEYRPMIQLAVSVSFDRVLTAHPELAENAAQVTKAVQDALNGGRFTSVKEAVDFFASLIPFDKMDEDARLLVQQVIQATAAQIQMIANRYKIPEATRLSLVKDIMRWGNEVAMRHVHEENQAAHTGKRKKIRAMR